MEIINGQVYQLQEFDCQGITLVGYRLDPFEQFKLTKCRSVSEFIKQQIND
jgi:hypothetical protein